ncbi:MULTISPECIES: tyrosine-type recombinase/integrase [Vagococcus]|uniref:Phage integrase n=1 Tax=Vagococcus fluvialis bH819 TaxID=1255619 RepID=A0A1X6WMH0_9ENTE|nr:MULTISPECIES: tyrosine-type recombinase/integrase [Vagococcus]SLM85470.1 Phage integrase [Vagococcus fluvialis bH819]HCM89235.1 site-specific integrase [Vagococcus sp.]
MKKEHKIKVEPIRDKKVLNEFINELNTGKNGRRNVLIFKIGLSTGLRISDIIKIKVSDVKGKTEFELVEQKTTKKRKVYLHNVLTELTEYLNTLDDVQIWLFSNTWDNSKHISSNQFYKILQKAANSLELDYIGTHSMRKTFGYWYYREYKDVATLMTIFNHSSPSITLRYIGITDEEIRNTLKDFKIF